MPRIIIELHIEAPIAIVFDLARSIDLHKISTSHTNEQAISGKTSGLINLHEQVTWKAKHFGIYQRLSSKITALKKPYFFVDEMVAGAFHSFKHEHHFKTLENGTVMTDIFVYKAPLGFLGSLANILFLKKYMTQLLTRRNMVIKNFAETEQWKSVLK